MVTKKWQASRSVFQVRHRNPHLDSITQQCISAAWRNGKLGLWWVLSTVTTGRQTRDNRTPDASKPDECAQHSIERMAAHSSPHNQTSARKKAVRHPHTALTVVLLPSVLRHHLPGSWTEGEPAEVLELVYFQKL